VGPPAPLPTTARRRLLEHVEALSQLAARTSTAPLVEAARSGLLRGLKRRLPQLAGLDAAARVAHVARLTGLPEYEVELALSAAASSKPGQLLAIARAQRALWRST
jgi:hypothetical protein